MHTHFTKTTSNRDAGLQPGVNNICKASHLVSLITLIDICITPLIDSNQDGVRIRQYNFHTGNRSCLQFWDDFEMNDKCQTDGGEDTKQLQCEKTWLPEIIMASTIRCFPATYLETLSTSISSKRQWKKFRLLQKKKLEDYMTQTINKCVKLKFKLQLNVL